MSNDRQRIKSVKDDVLQISELHKLLRQLRQQHRQKTMDSMFDGSSNYTSNGTKKDKKKRPSMMDFIANNSHLFNSKLSHICDDQCRSAMALGNDIDESIKRCGNSASGLNSLWEEQFVSLFHYFYFEIVQKEASSQDDSDDNDVCDDEQDGGENKFKTTNNKKTAEWNQWGNTHKKSVRGTFSTPPKPKGEKPQYARRATVAGSDMSNAQNRGTGTGAGFGGRGDYNRRHSSMDAVHHPFAVDTFKETTTTHVKYTQPSNFVPSNGSLPSVHRAMTYTTTTRSPLMRRLNGGNDKFDPTAHASPHGHADGPEHQHHQHQHIGLDGEGGPSRQCVASIFSMIVQMVSSLHAEKKAAKGKVVEYKNKARLLKKKALAMEKRANEHKQLLVEQNQKQMVSQATSADIVAQRYDEKIKAMNQTIEAMKAEAQAVAHQHQAQIDQMKEGTSASSDMEAIITSNNLQLNQARDSLVQAQSKHTLALNKFEQEKRELEGRVKELLEQLSSSKLSLEQMNQSRSEHSDTVSDYEKKVFKLTEKHKASTDALKETHTNELADQKQEYECKLTQMRLTHDKQMEEQEKEVNRLRREKREAKDKEKANKAAASKTAESAAEDAEAEKIKTEKKLMTAKKEMESWKRKFGLSNKELKALKESTENDTKKFAKEKKMNEKMKVMLDKLKKDKKDFQTKVADLKKKIKEGESKAELNAEIEKLQKSLGSLTNTLKLLREERERFKKKLEEEQTKNMGLSQQYTQLQNEHAQCAGVSGDSDAKEDKTKTSFMVNGKEQKKPSSGFGKCIYDEGEFYEGMWKDHERHGQGIYVWADGRKYEGMWHNDRKHGHGYYYWADGDRYEGEYDTGKMHGHGTYFFHDGTRYEGEWMDDMSHGQGVFFYNDGARYEGRFRKDKKNGPGRMFNTDKSVYDEEWEDGKRTQSTYVGQEEDLLKVKINKAKGGARKSVSKGAVKGRATRGGKRRASVRR